ncbi:nuclease-related domain-containing protein [Virgibacillus byunsanensis]|uniref:Nuclease-related domain-containing protein n=1 Tax=Virgibacillus byunsanensis TaxID=570945 RepID=A0ABW3LQB1_9BACI
MKEKQMIIRKRPKPVVLEKMDALNQRVSPSTKRRIALDEELARRYKGFYGEQKVDRFMETYFAHRFTILHDVSLIIDGFKVQIDTILITNHALFIIEIKNFNGTITFNTILNQFTRDDGHTETGFRHPITQAETIQLHLSKWLHDQNLYDIPVYFFVAISEPSTIIKVIGNEQYIANIVAHGEHIPKKIEQMDERIEKEGQARIKGQKIGRALLRDCREFEMDILRKNNVKKAEIKVGVICPKCGVLGMERHHSCWKCTKCNMQSKNAHIRTLKEYFLLFQPWITNEECMRFLGIQSHSLATRLLKSSGLKYEPKHRRWIK